MRVSRETIQERERALLEALQQHKKLTIDEIADMFAVTPSSVRRQLQSMEERGMVTRTYKGVVLAPDWQFEYDARGKRYSNTPEKAAIALKAQSFIKEQDIILLGYGTTILELAKQLKKRKNLMVVTPSILVAYELHGNPDIELQIIGGIVRPYTGSVIGPQTLRFLEGIHFDKAFVGADSISLENGITTPNPIELELDQFVIENSGETFLCADHSKFDKVTLAHVAPLEAVDYVITTSDNCSDCIRALSGMERPRVVFAPPI